MSDIPGVRRLCSAPCIGLVAAVLIGSLWFVAMLRTSEMPAHE